MYRLSLLGLLLLSLFITSCDRKRKIKVLYKNPGDSQDIEDVVDPDPVPEEEEDEDPPVSSTCSEKDFKSKKMVEYDNKKQVDILLVIDTSPSIVQERANIVAGLSEILKSLNNKVNVNTAVMLAHSPDSKYSGSLFQKGWEAPVLKSDPMSLPARRNILSEKLINPPGEGLTDGGEAGLLSILEALKPEKFQAIQKAGMFREGASVAIIFVSDEQDVCAKYPEGVTAVPDPQYKEHRGFVKYCIAEKLDHKKVELGGAHYTYTVTPEMVYQKITTTLKNSSVFIGGILYDENSTIPKGNEDEIGYGYLDLIRLNKGANIPITGKKNEYAAGLKHLADQAIKTITYRNSFPLDSEMLIVDTLEAFVDGDKVSVSYDSESKNVVIDSKDMKDGDIKIKYCEVTE